MAAVGTKGDMRSVTKWVLEFELGLSIKYKMVCFLYLDMPLAFVSCPELYVGSCSGLYWVPDVIQSAKSCLRVFSRRLELCPLASSKATQGAVIVTNGVHRR